MRLLQRTVDGEISLTKDYDDKEAPRYAILSHTWGDDDHEVSFQDIKQKLERSKPGYQKIQFCANQATRDDIRYFWVDTCCIDKSDIRELQWSINSMFRWYRNAAKCYVYLSGVLISENELKTESPHFESLLKRARWFYRGWTLQELLAPTLVEFFSANHLWLGDKWSLRSIIHKITEIPTEALQKCDPMDFSIHDCMSWMTKRETKYEEDMVYSLLGFFGVCLPALYGEGKQKALGRLQDEIKKFPKKRELDELSTASGLTLNPTKRSRTSFSGMSSIYPGQDQVSVDSERPLLSKNSIAGNAAMIIDKQ